MTYRPLPKAHASPLQALADERRNVATRAERRLERILNTVNGGALRGRFSREWVCGKHWIVDFFFPEVRLAVEVDGPYHRTPDRLFKDLAREIEIEKFGVTIVRLTNEQIFGDREVLLAVLRDGWRNAQTALTSNGHSSEKRQLVSTESAKDALEATKSKFYKATKRAQKPFSGGWTNLDQGVQRIGDSLSKRYVDEGFTGSREEHYEMRRQRHRDARKRGGSAA